LRDVYANGSKWFLDDFIYIDRYIRQMVQWKIPSFYEPLMEKLLTKAYNGINYDDMGAGDNSTIYWYN